MTYEITYTGVEHLPYLLVNFMFRNIWNDSYFSYISILVISTIGYITNLQWPALQTVMPELASIFSGSFSTAQVVYSTVRIISTFIVFFNGNKEKSYLRLSLKSFQWLFSTFIFKKNMENIPFLFAPRFNELLQSFLKKKKKNLI